MKRFGKRTRDELFGRRERVKRRKTTNSSESKEPIKEEHVPAQDVANEKNVRTVSQPEDPCLTSDDENSNGRFVDCSNGSLGQGEGSSSDESNECYTESVDYENGEEDEGTVYEKQVNDPIQKDNQADVINEQHLLGSLLSFGSHRIRSKMYNVVRKLLVPKDCSVCGAPGTGIRLPGLTTMKNRTKRMVKAWYARHDVVQLTVDEKRAGAKTGVDKFLSSKTAPVVVVKPSEWARRDFHTPSIRNAIWGSNVNEKDRVFSSIESAPIVRNRDIHMSEIRMPGRNGLERSVMKGSKVEVRLVRDEHVDRMLRNITFDDVKYEKKEKVRTAIISASVLHTEYISHDSTRHKTLDGNKFKFHKGGSEKAGDVIVYLECEGAKCRLVNRHNVDEGEPSVFLSVCTGNSHECKIRKVLVDNCICLDDKYAEDPPTPNQGTLNNGTRFFVYRFLLYTDGFNAHRSRTGSMDGMYIMPLGVPLEQRTEAGCLHKICLAPPGVSATDIIDSLNEDIIKGMNDGIDVMLHNERCKLFLDLVCYIGDSPALAHATGCKGHTSDTPCHVCTFQRNKQSKLEVVERNGVTSSSCAERRTYNRVMDICVQENGRRRIDRLGISNLEAPLTLLTKAIREMKDIPTSSNGRVVVPCSFDVFRCSLISPDHVFLGLIGNLMEAILRIMKPKMREEFDIECVDILQSNGLLSRKSVLNAEMNIVKCTISEAYAILFIAPIVFKRMRVTFGESALSDSSKQKALMTLTELVAKLKKIVISAQSNPDPSIDPVSVLKEFNEDDGRKRLEELVQDSRSYGAMVERLAEERMESAHNLDRPNVHRFLSCSFTHFHFFGSLKLIEELILEKGHQSAKKAIDMSNMKNEQVQAMNDYLHDDLVCRLKSITKDFKSSEKNRIRDIDVDLKNLLGMSPECGSPASNVVAEDILTTIRMVGTDICHRKEVNYWVIECSKENPPKGHDEEMRFVENNLKEKLQQASDRHEWSGKVKCERGMLLFSAVPRASSEIFNDIPKSSQLNFWKYTQILLMKIRV